MFASALATNGVEMRLFVPNGYNVSWEVAGPVTATNITSGPPVIMSQPSAALAAAHGSAAFSVTVFGAMPLKYQWSLNGTNIPGATGRNITIGNVRQADLGTYAVIVTNDFGVVTSAGALLSMRPYLAVRFRGGVTCLGKAATLSIEAWGAGPLAYQWFHEGVAIPGATDRTLALAEVQLTDAGFYSVVVSSPLGSVTNPPAELVVQDACVDLRMYAGLNISGQVGASYVVSFTTNLTAPVTWLPLATNTMPSSGWFFLDMDSPFSPKRFYKAKLGP